MTPADLDRTPLRDLVDRYLDLALRDFTSWVTSAPLTAAEHVELLTVGAAVARHVTLGRQVDVRPRPADRGELAADRRRQRNRRPRSPPDLP